MPTVYQKLLNNLKILERQSHMANSMNHHEQGVCSKRPSSKAIAALARRAYTGVREHDKGRERRWRTFSTDPAREREGLQHFPGQSF